MTVAKLIQSIPEEEKTPTVILLLEALQLLQEENQRLKDEIARLKGQKPKPKIKPSNLDKKTDKKKDTGKKKRKRKKRSKTKDLSIDEDIKLQPEHIPPGSEFIEYKDYVVQDLILASWNIRYRRARWKTPSGDYIIAPLPEHIKGHFGSDLISFVLYQHYGCAVTQPLIAEQLRELGIDISDGQINNILIQNKDRFHREKDEILTSALKMSRHINVDDTGARHKGKNGYCTHIGNEYFAWFKSTDSKSRINFLEILRADHTDYVLNEDALEYMAVQGLARYQLAKLEAIKDNVFQTLDEWRLCLTTLDICRDNHVRIATEGALVGSIIDHGFNKQLAIVSDDAGQFNIFLHALCWVHAERSIHKLTGFSVENETLLKQTRSDIWQLYSDLKDYRINPAESAKIELEERFDELFTRKTNFASLNQALKRIHENKSELLLVLDRPDIPLHNNLSESDIREYAKRRKISGSTRSDVGRQCRDTFMSLKKTCRKLGTSFWEYLLDRTSYQNQIPPLAQLMALKMGCASP
jgi:hypothetical protein